MRGSYPSDLRKQSMSKLQLSESRKEAREAALRERGLLPPLITTSSDSQSTPASQRTANLLHDPQPLETEAEPRTDARPGSPTPSDFSETETVVESVGVNPTIHTRESIWAAVNEIEDPEARRLATLAYLG
ncbi:hypothetical protein L218DRAFT_1000557 [Marasmius fiardii PR-910]|nr:hypothetical protein L218DRAFT_1000557 [Marasmius fiardii PR-910]